MTCPVSCYDNPRVHFVSKLFYFSKECNSLVAESQTGQKNIEYMGWFILLFCFV